MAKEKAANPEQKTADQRMSGLVVGTNTIVPVPDVAADTGDDGDGEGCAEYVEPVARLAYRLAQVAEGGAMTGVQDLLVEIMPKDRTEAEAFLKQVQRLSHAAEQAYRMAHEVFLTRR